MGPLLILLSELRAQSYYHKDTDSRTEQLRKQTFNYLFLESKLETKCHQSCQGPPSCLGGGKGRVLVCLEMQLKLTSNPLLVKDDLKLLTSYLYLLSARIISTHHHAWFMWCWGQNSGLCACWASTLPTRPQPQDPAVATFGHKRKRWSLVVLRPDH